MHALGALEATEVILETITPLGDRFIINFKGFNLAIRKKYAKNIFIKWYRMIKVALLGNPNVGKTKLHKNDIK